eukprot:403350406
MYAYIKSNSFTIQKDKQDKEQRLKLALSTLTVEGNAKDQTEFFVNYMDQNKKPQKLSLKAQDQKERDKWLQTLQDFINKVNLDIDIFSQDDPLVQPFKDNLYEAFSSRFFVDECDLDTKMQAYNEVEKMFSSEIDNLQDMVKATVEEEKGNQITRKIVNVKNLCKTMGDLIKNIVNEIDSSREQMFRILESIAVLEISRDAKKFNIEKIKHSKINNNKTGAGVSTTNQQKPSKKSNLLIKNLGDLRDNSHTKLNSSRSTGGGGGNHSYNYSQGDGSGGTNDRLRKDFRMSSDVVSQTNIFSSRNKKQFSSLSSSSSQYKNQPTEIQDLSSFPYAMDFDEEEKHSDTSSVRSGYYKGRESSADETEFEFGIDDEEDIFLDARDEIIVQNQQLVKQSKIFIQDVFEERLSLPHLRPPNQKISFWQVFKDLVGKDLTRVSMPVYFNEPLSLNQKLAETVEYNDLLERAAQEPNSLIRLALITAYTATRYTNVNGRMNKPFNSLLGETYELVTTKYRFVSEQVSHHPPITAYHCENNFYEIYAQTRTTMRFNGKYVLFAPKDRVYINLKLIDGTTEFYSSTLPMTSVHNLIIGKLYIDVHGKTSVINHTTQETCEVEWKERGWSGKNANIMNAIVKTPSGKALFKVHGRFTDSLNLVNLDTNEESEIWRASPKPEQADHMYEFTQFALQLNYLPDSLIDKLPHSDSRFRPDQRALENGNTENAIKEKHRLEEAQRQRRKDNELVGKKHAPVYFDEKLIEATNDRVFKFNGRYWEDRDKKDWSNITKIFD